MLGFRIPVGYHKNGIILPSVFVNDFNWGQIIRTKFYFGEFVSHLNFHLDGKIVTMTLHQDLSAFSPGRVGGIIIVYQIEKRNEEMPYR